MENIGPVVLFLGYMIFSAWAKQRKARAGNAGKAGTPEKQSIFDQIKAELQEMGREMEEFKPPGVVIPDPVEIHPSEPEIVREATVEAPHAEMFQEGSSRPFRKVDVVLGDDLTTVHPAASTTRSLEAILAEYSVLERGMLLKEILGPPKSMNP